MVVQAEAARYLIANADRLDETLAAITDTGRRAISDLREILDLLNPDHEPTAPPADAIATLVEQTRQAGLQVELVQTGTPQDAGRTEEEAAYRVVQEALTNALKYDSGGRTVVRIQYGTSEICVDVVSEGSGSRANSPGGSGRGLAGLRQRVGVLGGEFSAGPRPDGRFFVHAQIPSGNPS
jgi:signal transduction histidine kinase